jgi:hypothetical protein
MTTPTDQVAADIDLTPPPAQAGTPMRADEWIELLPRTDAPEVRPDLFDAAYRAIAEIVRADPDADRSVGRIIEGRTSRVGPEQLLGEITEALEVYLGTDGAYLVHWGVYLDVADRLERIAAAAEPAVIVFMRRVLAEHGGSLDLAQRVAFSGMHDWSRIDKRAWVDALTGRQEFAIVLHKLDGSSMRLECSADSVMNLATHLLELVNAQQSMTGFGSGALGRYANQLQNSVSLLAADFGQDETSEQAGEVAPD